MIFLDLDGVFVDYRKHFRSVLGWEYHDDPKSAWPVLDKVDNLFYYAPALPGAKKLYNTIIELAEEAEQGVCFLTAMPSRTNKLITAEYDKTMWVHEYLDPKASVICVPNWKYKKFYARRGSILIDDSPRNIIDWSYVGGLGIVHFDNEATCKTLQLLLSVK